MREPVTYIEIDQDFCTRTYGVAPCQAAVGVTGSDKCYNTLVTCQDPDNYRRGKLTLRFTNNGVTPPKGVYGIPSVHSISTTPTVINPGGGGKRSGPLGQRASLRVVINDHPSSDTLVDPYVDERGYDPVERGTYWTKWIARNPYYNNREIRVLDGFVGQPLSEMSSRTYLIDRIDGPDQRGRVTITAKDVLRLADDDKALVPNPSPGELVSDLGRDANITTLDVTGASTSDYPSSGTLRINRECFRYTGRAMSGSNLRFSGVTRATDGTERVGHRAGDRVQQCIRYTNKRADALAYEWLTQYARVPTQFIDYAAWQQEADLWLGQFEMDSLITEPTGVTQLLSEITEQCLFHIWWDERAQKIRFEAVAPKIYEDIEAIDDVRNVLADSVRIKDDPASRISQVWLFWQQRDPTESLTKDDNYTKVRIRADADSEREVEYDEQKIRKVYSRWLKTEGQVINLSTRLLNKLRDTPKTMTIELDVKDRRFWTGDVIDVTHMGIVDYTGLPVQARWQILSAEEIEQGHRVRYELDLFEFMIGALPGRWTESNAPDFINATPEERTGGAWWSDEDGKIDDGENLVDGYTWI